MTHINFKLEIRGGKITVPGCEPSTSITSKTLAAYLAKDEICRSSILDVKTVMKAIPGCTIERGINYNRGGQLQMWLVLPDMAINCPCGETVDYYNILRTLESPEVQETEIFRSCDLISMGYCPSPDFENTPSKPESTYTAEGTFGPGGENTGYLPPVPPW